MTGRLPSGLLVNALLRRVNDAGGIGMVLAKGESSGGAILTIALKNNKNPRVLERGIGSDGRTCLMSWMPSDGEDLTEVTAYWQRRRQNDPDLWVIELDIPFAERFAAETILVD